MMEVLLKAILVCVIGFVTEARGRMTDMMDSQQKGALKVQVEVPSYVRAGDTAELKCKYDLGSDTLYAVKWYKGKHEFYRYTPKESPAQQTFPPVGLQIDLDRSDATLLTLRNVDLRMTATYSCEVTVDFPEFTTEVKAAVLYVVAFPEHPPKISLSKRSFALGDIVEANCTSVRSKPAANITWYINGNQPRPMDLTPLQIRRDIDSRETSIQGIRFPLAENHFTQGRLSLRCTARIHGWWHQSSTEHISADDKPKLSSVVDNSSSSCAASRKFSSDSLSHNQLVKLLSSGPSMNLVALGFLHTTLSTLVKRV